GGGYAVAVLVREVVAVDEAVGWVDLVEDAAGPDLAVLRRGDAEVQASAHAELDWASGFHEAVGRPPLHEVGRVRPCLPDELPWRFDHALQEGYAFSSAGWSSMPGHDYLRRCGVAVRPRSRIRA